MVDLSEIFGKPGEGVHSVRLFNIAILDVIGTIIGAWIISSFFNVSFKITLVSLFILGIILHRLFGVKTTIDQALP